MLLNYALPPNEIVITTNGYTLSARIDSGNSNSFVNEKVARDLKFTIHESYGTISLAFPNTSVQVGMHRFVNIHIGKKAYEAVKLNILNDRCTYVILSKDFHSLHKSFRFLKLSILKDHCIDAILSLDDFHRLHKSVCFVKNGAISELMVPLDNNICNILKADMLETPLFDSMPKGVKPIATESRKFSLADSEFIESEI
ncbi:hypothetical protein GJ496_009719 [Pomphorhynchus laevis]|nr:hypothetical protein GJ496_009719 [Pomphorhynchus laevis]